MTCKPYEIKRISHHVIGRPGRVEVRGSTESAMKAGIEAFFEEYPENPYGTYLDGKPQIDDNGLWVQTICHFGSD